MKNFTQLLRIISLLSFLFLGTTLFAQVGIGTTSPSTMLEVEANSASDGITINNVAADGDPIVRYQVNGTSRITMGIDDNDVDKFKIGTTAITFDTRMTIQTNGFIGFRTTTPTNMFQMTNGGTTVGATSMANFENSGVSGVAIGGRNSNNTSGYNAIEGLTDYNGTAFIPAGVFGLAIYNGPVSSPTIGVRGVSNEWQGTGVRGSRFNGGGANTGWGGEFYDDLGYTGFLGTISDEKTKTNIQEINGALEIIKQLNPVTYNYDLAKYPNMGLNRGTEYGFISQEISEILPEVTRQKSFSTNATLEAKPNEPLKNESELFIVMDYTRIIPILTKGVKEQQTIIETQNSKIESLEQKLELLNKKVDNLLNRHN
jgi:hypothetical protein